MADVGNKGDQLEETLKGMKTDIAAIKKEMNDSSKRISIEIKKGIWFHFMVFFYTLGFAFLVAAVTLGAEKNSLFMTFIAPTVFAFAVGYWGYRRSKELEKKLTEETKSK
jgi:hypothetical protein